MTLIAALGDRDTAHLTHREIDAAIPLAPNGVEIRWLCGSEPFAGFHWCSYGLVEGAIERLAAAGLVVDAHAADAGVEGFELPGRSFYVATLFQPQVGSSTRSSLHSLLHALIDAAR